MTLSDSVSIRRIDARWRPLEGAGLDHVTLSIDAERIVARGVVIGERAGVRYGVYYRVDLDPLWRVREVALGAADGRGLHLLSDGQGHWTTGQGAPLPQFDGCFDVDLSATPFTNTPPIRRNAWKTGERAHLRMVYVPFDSFEPVADGQIYTCLEPGRRFLYEAADGSFRSELTIDEDGLVVDYPSLFAREP